MQLMSLIVRLIVGMSTESSLNVVHLDSLITDNTQPLMFTHLTRNHLFHNRYTYTMNS